MAVTRTNGPWVVGKPQMSDCLRFEYLPILGERGNEIALVISATPTGDVCRSKVSATLIAEAGTVAHETGLTPRQLAEQRAELLAALKLLSAEEWRDDDDPILISAREQARAAIAKAEGGAA